MDILLSDLKYGFRTLVKSPAFTLLAILALAFGIAVNTAIFTVVNAVLIQPLPYSDPDRMYMLWEKSHHMETSVAYPNFLDWRAENDVFETLVAFRRDNMNLTSHGEPERVSIRMVSFEFFKIFGIPPEPGRDFRKEEDQPGAQPVVIISYPYWKNRFGASREILGSQISLNDRWYTVIGIASENFDFGAGADIFVPIGQFSGDHWKRENHPGIYVLGRLKNGVAPEQMNSAMQGIASSLAAQYPDSNTGDTIVIQGLRENTIGDVRQSLLLLTGAVALVLLIACANVANMMLVRTAERSRELAVRSALGAGRMRIVRQVLTESFLLTGLSSILGILIAYWGVDLLLLLRPDSLPRLNEIALNGHVLLFTLGVTLATTLLFGSLPAWKASKPDLNEALKDASSKQSGGAAQKRLRQILVISEVALALVLLIGAGLLMRSFMSTQAVNPGFDPSGVLTLSISLPEERYQPARVRSFFEQLQKRVSGLPEVESFAYSNGIPLAGAPEEVFFIEGRPPVHISKAPQTVLYVTSPDYFRTLGITLIKGRHFTERDDLSSEFVCIVDQKLAQQYFPDEDPIGKRLQMGHAAPRMRIIGLVQHVKHYGIDSAGPIQAQMYFPFHQVPEEFLSMVAGGVTLLVKSKKDPTAMAETIRNEVRALDPKQPVYQVQTMERWISDSLAARRFAMLLLSIFAVMALVLALIGLYGVMSYSVVQRTREIGIRVALGAGRGDIVKMILNQGLIPVVIGVALGITAAAASSSILSGMLFQTTQRDPVTFALIPLFMFAVATLASYVPARRALQVDPMTALKYE